ncbi:unnamed protein product, partial [Lymnaea stagnalis]
MGPPTDVHTPQDSGFFSENSAQQNRRPLTTHSSSYRHWNTQQQMDFVRPESNATDFQLRNERLTVENEHLRQRKQELVHDQMLWRHDKQDFENRIVRVNDEILNLKSNHRRDIDDLQKQKIIEIQDLKIKCRMENRLQMEQKIEDLRGGKDDELMTERTERTRVETKYQILLSSNEEFKKLYEGAVAKEQATRDLLHQRDSENAEKLEIKSKELEGARVEIIKLKHDAEIAARDYDASNREMILKHASEMKDLKHDCEKNMAMQKEESLQRENT